MKRSSSAASSSSTVPPAALMFHGLLKGHREGDTEGRYKVPIPTAEEIIMPMSYVHERYFGRPSCAKCGELMMAPSSVTRGPFIFDGSRFPPRGRDIG